MANIRFTFKEASEKSELVAYHATMSFTSFNSDWCVNHKDEEGWYYLDNGNRVPVEFYEVVKEFRPSYETSDTGDRTTNIEKDIEWFRNKGFEVSYKAIEKIYYEFSNFGVLAYDPHYLNTDEFEYDNPFGYTYIKMYVQYIDWCTKPFYKYCVWNTKDECVIGEITYVPHKYVKVKVVGNSHPIYAEGLVCFIEYDWMKFEYQKNQWGVDSRVYTFTDKYCDKYGQSYNKMVMTDEEIKKTKRNGEEDIEVLIIPPVLL